MCSLVKNLYYYPHGLYGSLRFDKLPEVTKQQKQIEPGFEIQAVWTFMKQEIIRKYLTRFLSLGRGEV